VSEWSKEHAWKVCMAQKVIVGSNPILSAIRVSGIVPETFLRFRGWFGNKLETHFLVSYLLLS
jgi:hypothetical protein